MLSKPADYLFSSIDLVFKIFLSCSNVAELLYIIENRTSRSILMDIIDYFAQCRSSLVPVATILNDVRVLILLILP